MLSGDNHGVQNEVCGVKLMAEVGSDGDEGPDMVFVLELGRFQEADVPNHRG